MLPHKNYPTGLYMIKAFTIDKGNDSLHSIGGICMIDQALERANLNEIFKVPAVQAFSSKM